MSQTLRVSLTVVAALVALLSAAGQPVSACNMTYCSSRGNGTALVSGPDGCACSCEWPYFGYRCLYQYVRSANVVINCSAPNLTSSAVACNATGQCFFNATSGACLSSIYPPYVNNVATPLPRTAPWCVNTISMPLQLIVYAFATAAFGVAGIGFAYLLRFRKTYSIVNETGERTFNQFYSSPWLAIVYTGLLFVASACLAISAYVNFRDPSACAVVVFFWIYIAVQALVLLLPLKWLVEFLVHYYSSPVKRMVDLDLHTKPIHRQILQNKRRTCQMRCF